MKTDLFQSCGHCWVFQICRHIEWNTFTASFFRIWNSSTGIPSPPLALFIVMLSKALLTSCSGMSGCRWVITPSWLAGRRSFGTVIQVSLSHVRLFATPWTVACQAPLSMGILQTRILEWVAMPSSGGSSQPRDQTQVSLIVGGFFTVWATREAQECWNGYPLPSPGDIPDPGIKPESPALQADSLPVELPEKPPTPHL